MLPITLRRRAFEDHPDWVVVGLGNPGAEYAATRHNIGFRVIEKLADRLAVREFRYESPSWLAASRTENGTLLLCLPSTYMNRSGLAVQLLQRRYHMDLERCLVICDDVHLPLGTLRLRRKGSSGGQKGLQSIIDRTGSEEFPRLRCGVGPRPEGISLPDFVLAPFAAEDIERGDNMAERAASAVLHVMARGVEDAMQTFHRA